MRKTMNRIRKKSYIFFIFLLSYSGIILNIEAQDTEHVPIVEEVSVTNVEVPVRVLFKGEPVTDLTIDDFILYENKKEVKINGFYKKEKKIKIETNSSNIKKSSIKAKKRTFVLVFNVTKYNNSFEKAINHLFNNILRGTDHIIIFTHNTTREYNGFKNKSNIKKLVTEDLKRESKQAKYRLLEYINRLENFINSGPSGDNFKRFLEDGTTDGGIAAHNLIEFIKKYLLAWNEYKKRYLTPRLENFYYFARYLERINGEKWVFNFYQFEFFPKIRLSSRAMQKIKEISNVLSNSSDGAVVSQGHLLNKLINRMMIDYDITSGFPYDEISKLFYKVDATFHSFFIPSTNPIAREDFEYKVVSSDLEKTLKKITNITGGKNLTSVDLVQSLNKITEVNDVYYMITYIPHDPQKAGKLKIKVKNKKYRVLYDDNFRADYISEYLNKLEENIKIPSIEIKDFSFEKKILRFNVTNYLIKKTDGSEGDNGFEGKVKVKIQLYDSKSECLFDQEKVLSAQNKELTISLNTFKNLNKGDYSIILDATDMYTGKTDNFLEAIIVK